MKSHSLFLVLVAGLSTSAIAQSPQPSCMVLEDVDSSLDPVAITRSMLACIEQEKYEEAVDLFNIGGVFAKFDTQRVSDVSAHSAYPALKAHAAQLLYQAQQERFNQQQRTISAGDLYHDKLCRFATRLPPPSYAPTYMTNYGMGAFTGTPQMENDFDPKLAWGKVLSSYLKCK